LPTYETNRERAIQTQPIKRVGRRDDMADAVAFLASDRAGFVDPAALHVTGGRGGCAKESES
jgi:3-oxoacyl-[acyl-carrier protein] reductase